MERLPPIPPDARTAAQQQAAADFKTARDRDVFGPFVPLLYSPEMMSCARVMGDYLRFRSALPPRLSEFVILMTAREWAQQYEWNLHCPLAIAAGVPAATAAAIAEGRRPDPMSEDEEILYEFCNELHRHRRISDAVYARAVTKFGERGVIDTLGIVGYYSLLAMVLNTARTPVDGGDTVPLAPLPPLPR